MKLTGECVLEEEWMTDICISFWDVKSLDISIYLQIGLCKLFIVYLLLWMELLFLLSFIHFQLVILCAYLCIGLR